MPEISKSRRHDSEGTLVIFCFIQRNLNRKPDRPLTRFRASVFIKSKTAAKILKFYQKIDRPSNDFFERWAEILKTADFTDLNSVKSV